MFFNNKSPLLPSIRTGIVPSLANVENQVKTEPADENDGTGVQGVDDGVNDANDEQNTLIEMVAEVCNEVSNVGEVLSNIQEFVEKLPSPSRSMFI